MSISLPSGPSRPVDATCMRDVVGRFATGVVVVTALDEGAPVGMTCQSFASLSLDPPLVSLSPARTSTTWPRIRNAGRFCVNVLAADQAAVSDRFARSGGDKFSGMSWVSSPAGLPRLLGALAWIEAAVVHEYDGGDHTVVVAAVTDLRSGDGGLPLLFHRGRYGTVGDPSGTMQ